MAPPLDIDDSIDANPACSRCSAVCCQLKVMLLPDDRIPQHLTDEDEYGLPVMRRADDGWCVALDRETFRCTIHLQRPWVCGAFDEAGEDCRAERAAWRAAAMALRR